MRSTKKVMRSVIYQALNGQVNVGGVVPVYDEKRPDNSTADVYILLSTQQETELNTQDTFITESSIDIEVCQNTGAAVSKDKIDDIENNILTILMPTPGTDGTGFRGSLGLRRMPPYAF
jgi:hypothetical protein